MALVVEEMGRCAMCVGVEDRKFGGKFGSLDDAHVSRCQATMRSTREINQSSSYVASVGEPTRCEEIVSKITAFTVDVCFGRDSSDKIVSITQIIFSH